MYHCREEILKTAKREALSTTSLICSRASCFPSRESSSLAPLSAWICCLSCRDTSSMKGSLGVVRLRCSAADSGGRRLVSLTSLRAQSISETRFALHWLVLPSQQCTKSTVASYRPRKSTWSRRSSIAWRPTCLSHTSPSSVDWRFSASKRSAQSSRPRRFECTARRPTHRSSDASKSRRCSARLQGAKVNSSTRRFVPESSSSSPPTTWCRWLIALDCSQQKSPGCHWPTSSKPTFSRFWSSRWHCWAIEPMCCCQSSPRCGWARRRSSRSPWPAARPKQISTRWATCLAYRKFHQSRRWKPIRFGSQSRRPSASFRAGDWHLSRRCARSRTSSWCTKWRRRFSSSRGTRWTSSSMHSVATRASRHFASPLWSRTTSVRTTSITSPLASRRLCSSRDWRTSSWFSPCSRRIRRRWSCSQSCRLCASRFHARLSWCRSCSTLACAPRSWCRSARRWRSVHTSIGCRCRTWDASAEQSAPWLRCWRIDRSPRSPYRPVGALVTIRRPRAVSAWARAAPAAAATRDSLSKARWQAHHRLEPTRQGCFHRFPEAYRRHQHSAAHKHFPDSYSKDRPTSEVKTLSSRGHGTRRLPATVDRTTRAHFTICCLPLENLTHAYTASTWAKLSCRSRTQCVWVRRFVCRRPCTRLSSKAHRGWAKSSRQCSALASLQVSRCSAWDRRAWYSRTPPSPCQRGLSAAASRYDSSASMAGASSSRTWRRSLKFAVFWL